MERRAEEIVMNALGHAYFRGKAGQGMYASALTELARALDKDGFEIVRKHGMDWREILRRREAERLRAWELGVTPPMGGAFRVSEARRTGDWSEVTDADWTAWVNALRDRNAFESSVLAAIERDRQPDKDAPGYLAAVRLLRGRLPSIKEIDEALGGASPDGSQGNVWALRQRIVDGRAAVERFWDGPEAASFEPAAEPKVKVGRVVVLDEAAERKLQDLLAGKSVPTGRLVEVTYRMPNGTTKTVRHAEFGKLDKVSYDPTPVAGAEIAGARVLSARETVKVPPGEKVVEVPGLMLRDNGILAVFYDDGIISFAGDAADMVAFRDMAARVVGVPVSRDAS
ncbi:hypothetical protein ACQKQD_19215 [Methylobacterium sp. NPDC080182]|uniref:hypothetical protein n=1 Tax=Methylobacterium sp. NPDC080182 TaxID=3390590 RepID=UPI003D0812FD